LSYITKRWVIMSQATESEIVIAGIVTIVLILIPLAIGLAKG